jgi:polyisoprenoid-binding protein YceI
MADENTRGDADALAHPVLSASVGDWVLDPAGSKVEFHVKHFWGATTVHGRFERLEGEATVAESGVANGQIRVDASSLTTGHGSRDRHLRAGDFFATDQHPTFSITVRSLRPDGPLCFAGDVVLEAAGHSVEIRPEIEVVEDSGHAIVLFAEAEIDRGEFDMTWSPLRTASRTTRGEVTARFVRR